MMIYYNNNNLHNWNKKFLLDIPWNILFQKGTKLLFLDIYTFFVVQSWNPFKITRYTYVSGKDEKESDGTSNYTCELTESQSKTLTSLKKIVWNESLDQCSQCGRFFSSMILKKDNNYKQKEGPFSKRNIFQNFNHGTNCAPM